MPPVDHYGPSPASCGRSHCLSAICLVTFCLDGGTCDCECSDCIAVSDCVEASKQAPRTYAHCRVVRPRAIVLWKEANYYRIKYGCLEPDQDRPTPVRQMPLDRYRIPIVVGAIVLVTTIWTGADVYGGKRVLIRGTVTKISDQVEGQSPCPCCGLGIAVAPMNTEGHAIGVAPSDVLVIDEDSISDYITRGDDCIISVSKT